LAQASIPGRQRLAASSISIVRGIDHISFDEFSLWFVAHAAAGSGAGPGGDIISTSGAGEQGRRVTRRIGPPLG
jgi:hypothetical protein